MTHYLLWFKPKHHPT